jgi:small subunit ribosomal protein S4
MGDPKFSRKMYSTPTHPWRMGRIKEENELIKKYGLVNKTEVWKASSILRNFRAQARTLQARRRTGDLQSEKETKQLLEKLANLGVLPSQATLDDVLALDVNAVLLRRLQTVVYMKGLAHTPKQARQFIIHGHTVVNNRKVTVPGYLVKKVEEDKIDYYLSSPLKNELHPMRLKPEQVTQEQPTVQTGEKAEEPVEPKKEKVEENVKGEEKELETETVEKVDSDKIDKSPKSDKGAAK